MTKSLPMIVAAVIALTSITPALAFTPSGTETDLSAKYANMPSWQANTADRGDSIYEACLPAISAGVNWKQCLLAFVAENRDKFPANFRSESDFFLVEGETYNTPVFTGVAANSAAASAPANVPTRADYLALVKVLGDFETRIAAVEGSAVTQGQLKAAVDAAIAAAAKAPGNNALAALAAELATQAGRLTALETGLANTNGLLNTTIADQATVNTETTNKLTALAAENAAAAGVLAGHATRLSATEVTANRAAADVLATNQALAGKVDTTALPGLLADGIAAAVADPNSELGQALAGKVDDAELAQAVADGVATVQTEVTSIWTWVFGTAAGLAVLALLGFLGFALNRQKVNQVATQVAEVEDRAAAVEIQVTGRKIVLIPDDFDDKLAALAKGDAEYITVVQVDGADHELGFTWAEPQNGKPQVTVRGIKDQFVPINVSNIRSRILRAAGKGHLEGLKTPAAFASARAPGAKPAAAAAGAPIGGTP